MTKQDHKEIARLIHAEIRPLAIQIEMLLEALALDPETEELAREIAVESKVEDLLRRIDGGYERKKRA